VRGACYRAQKCERCPILPTGSSRACEGPKDMESPRQRWALHNKSSSVTTMEFEANRRNWDGIAHGDAKFWSPLRDWDTGDVWEPGQRFRVTCRRSKHFRRRGTVLKVARRWLTVEFGDGQPGCFVVRYMVVHFPPAWALSSVCHEANHRLSWG
jgi:hypothetical protein